MVQVDEVEVAEAFAADARLTRRFLKDFVVAKVLAHFYALYAVANLPSAFIHLGLLQTHRDLVLTRHFKTRLDTQNSFLNDVECACRVANIIYKLPTFKHKFMQLLVKVYQPVRFPFTKQLVSLEELEAADLAYHYLML